MKAVKLIFSFVDKIFVILGILSYFGYPWLILKNQVKDLTDNRYFQIFLVFSILITIKLLWEKAKELKWFYTKYKVESEVNAIKKQTKISDIKEVIPSSRTLSYWFELILRRAKAWTEDSKLQSLNLYLDYENGHWKMPNLQCFFVSEWKAEKGCFYEGDLTGDDYEDPGKYTNYNLNIDFLLKKYQIGGN